MKKLSLVFLSITLIGCSSQAPMTSEVSKFETIDVQFRSMQDCLTNSDKLGGTDTTCGDIDNLCNNIAPNGSFKFEVSNPRYYHRVIIECSEYET